MLKIYKQIILCLPAFDVQRLVDALILNTIIYPKNKKNVKEKRKIEKKKKKGRKQASKKEKKEMLICLYRPRFL